MNIFNLDIGLYEVGTSFYGPDWENNQEAHDFTLPNLSVSNLQKRSVNDSLGVE